LPADVPSDVAALGTPQQVHLPDEVQLRRNDLLLRIMAGCTALVLLAIAGLHFFLLYQPFGSDPPPREVALSVGIGCAVLGLLFMATAIWFRASRWWRPRTYLVYEHVLVELSAQRHRIIPWKNIGPPKPSSALLIYYRFPVQDDRCLSFDNTVTDHEALCATIVSKAVEGRVQVALGDASTLAEMAGAQPGPFVVVARLSKGKGVFRVSMLGKRLLFYRVKAAPGVATQPVSRGGFNAWKEARIRQAYLDEMQLLAKADALTLVQLAAANPGSFAVAPEDVRELRIDPPSWWKHFFCGVAGTDQEALLTLVHERLGTMQLALLSREDVRTATVEFPKIFRESAVRINVEWSHSQCCFVRKG
jgi:hypothetical protein